MRIASVAPQVNWQKSVVPLGFIALTRSRTIALLASPTYLIVDGQLFSSAHAHYDTRVALPRLRYSQCVLTKRHDLE